MARRFERRPAKGDRHLQRQAAQGGRVSPRLFPIDDEMTLAHNRG